MKRGLGCGSPISGKSGNPCPGNGRYGPVDINFSDANIAQVQNVKIPSAIVGDLNGIIKPCLRCRPSIPGKAGYQLARNSFDNSRRRVDFTNAIRIRVRDNKIPSRTNCETVHVSYVGLQSRPAVAVRRHTIARSGVTLNDAIASYSTDNEVVWLTK